MTVFLSYFKEILCETISVFPSHGTTIHCIIGMVRQRSRFGSLSAFALKFMQIILNLESLLGCGTVNLKKISQ